MRHVAAAAALAVVVAVVVAPMALAQPGPGTAASTGSSTTTTTTPVDATQPYLTVEHVTPWVPEDGTWTATWAVAQEPPADAVLQYTIHQPLAGGDVRGALAGVIGGGDLGPSLHNEKDVPLSQLRNGATVTLDVPIRSHSGSSDRLLIPNAGILPIGVDLVDGSGALLQHSVLFLDRLPETATHPALRVAPRAEATSAPIVQPDGTSTISSDARSSLDDLLGLLRHQTAVPVTSTIDPELLAGLQRSTDPSDATRVAGLRNVLHGRPVLRSTWAPIDLDSWAATGSLIDLQTSVLSGQGVLDDATRATPESRIWPPDPTIGPGALKALEQLGTLHLLLAPNQLEPARELGSDPGTTRRVVVDSDGSGIDALVDDPTLTDQLRNRNESPGTSAHLLATELEAIWLSTPAGVTPAVSLDLSIAPAEVAQAVLDDLTTANPTIVPSTVAAAFDAASEYQTTSRRRTEPLVRKLVTPSGAHDIAPLSTFLDRLRSRAAAYHSTMTDPQGVAPLDQLLLTSQHRSLGDGGDRRYLDAAAARIDSDFSKILPPPGRSVTMTARTAVLPVRITNGLDRTVTVLLRFRGTRLGLQRGATRAVRLQPGQNPLTVPVVVRTSGDFTMTIEIRTADNSLLLSESTVRVRSTVVSGVGIVLGGGALAFLVLWWGLTIRRGRRDRAAGVRDAVDEPGEITPPTAEPASLA